MEEEKQIIKQGQSSKKPKTSDTLDFIMSDISHIAHTLDRILEAVSGRRITEKRPK